MLKPVVVSELNKALVFNLADRIDPVRAKVSAGLQAKEVAPGVLLNVNVSSFDISTVFVDDSAVGIFTNVRGIATVDVGTIRP